MGNISPEKLRDGAYGICGLMGEILNYKLIFIRFDIVWY